VAHDPVVHVELDVAGDATRNPITEVSALSCVLPETSAVVMPIPAAMLFELRNARWSVPPARSHVPLVADQVNKGIASAGNAVTLAAGVQPLLQLTVTFDPTVRTPALET
jgi:hypothetical protein